MDDLDKGRVALDTSALHLRATAFVTNDRDLPGIGSLRVVQLGHYV
jgi:hypothetical protein